jgi:hypothetical protein
VSYVSGIISISAGFLTDNTGRDGDSPLAISPAKTGGQADGDSPVGVAPAKTGGQADGDSPVWSAPAPVGGITDSDSPVVTDAEGTEIEMGSILGRSSDGSERPRTGGLGVGVEGAGEVSSRETLNVIADPDFPGVEWTAADNAGTSPKRTDLTLRPSGVVELARFSFDGTLAAPATVAAFQPGGAAAGAVVTEILIRSTDVTGLVSHPEFDLRISVLGDLIPQTAMTFTGNDLVRRLEVLATDMPFCPNGTDIVFGHDVAAVATTYTVQVIILGRVIPA